MKILKEADMKALDKFLFKINMTSKRFYTLTQLDKELCRLFFGVSGSVFSDATSARAALARCGELCYDAALKYTEYNSVHRYIFAFKVELDISYVNDIECAIVKSLSHRLHSKTNLEAMQEIRRKKDRAAALDNEVQRYLKTNPELSAEETKKALQRYIDAEL